MIRSLPSSKKISVPAVLFKYSTVWLPMLLHLKRNLLLFLFFVVDLICPKPNN
jgi:hypothetical protein